MVRVSRAADNAIAARFHNAGLSDSCCWGAEIKGSSDACSPGFQPGKSRESGGHFKTKLCAACHGSTFACPSYVYI